MSDIKLAKIDGDIYIEDYIASDFDKLSEKETYDWVINNDVYTGTLYDFIESVGFRHKFFYHCPRCNTYFSKTGASIRRSGFCCRSCVWKSATEENHKTIKENSIAVLYPEIKKYWDFDKNNRNINTVTIGEDSKFWFKCRKGHSYYSTPNHMIHSVNSSFHGCPVCAGQEFSEDNSVEKGYPEVLPYWDYELNKIKPSKVKKSTEEKYWFRCDKGHTFCSRPYKVSYAIRKGSSSKGCPYCGGKKVALENSFAGRSPDKLKYWDYSKNNVSPDKIAFYTEELYWFRCDKGHSYLSKPHSVAMSKGSGCRICTGREVLEGYNDLLTTDTDLVAKYWDSELSGIFPSEVTRQSVKLANWKCVKCGNSYEQRIDSRVNSVGLCPDCADALSSSKGEKDLLSFIESFGFNIKSNAYIGKYNYDIIIEDLKIVIEYNGIYYHSDAIDRYKDGSLNNSKLQNLKDKGYILYVVWEDDWIYKKDICKRSLMRKLGVSDDKKLNARDLYIKYLECSSGLLNTYHIQGDVLGCNYISLVTDTDEVVSELAYRVTSEGCYIVRYATSCIVRGGFGKVLKEILLHYSRVYTYSDNSISDGGLYKGLGFVAEKYLKPDYMYIQGGNRVHKFNFRIKRFREDETLLYREGLTERELATLNGLHRIYDYGKIKWIKEV